MIPSVANRITVVLLKSLHHVFYIYKCKGNVLKGLKVKQIDVLKKNMLFRGQFNF